MLKRMVGSVFSSSGSGNNRASGSIGSSTGSGAQAVLTPQPSAVVAEPRRASPGATSAAPSSNSPATASAAPAWAAPRTATREELEARRIAERKFITANDSTETDVWYLIDVDWLSDWKRFVLRSGPLPGPIRNESLIDSRSGRARPSLELVVNYRGVNAGIWKYWLQRYGGGPVIRRAQLDLYAEIVYDDFAHQGLFGADSALEDAGEPSDFASTVAGRGPFGPGSGNIASMGNEAFAFDHQSSGTSSGALAERAAAERAEDLAKPGKAGSRRSFSDFLKGYRGGGRSSRGSLPTAKATDTSTTTSTASSRGAQAPKNKDKDKKEERVDLGGGGSEMSASSSTSSPSELPGMNFFVKETDACVISQPMDGSCLFHSLSYGIDDGADATSLRLDISNYIAGNPDMVIAGTALKDWIKFDSGGKVAAYAAEMAGGTWGGGIEIEAFVRLKDVNVHVFESCPGGYRRICCFDAAPGSGDQRRDDARTATVTLLYQGREHYDALVLNHAAGKWVPRTGMAFHAGA